jgi:hypothetical protein
MSSQQLDRSEFSSTCLSWWRTRVPLSRWLKVLRGGANKLGRVCMEGLSEYSVFPVNCVDIELATDPAYEFLDDAN